MSKALGLWVAASIALVVAAPLLLHLAAYWQHLAAYHGVCGPHAPDIAAHPCDYPTYRAEFAAGFAGVGLLIVEAMLAVVVAMLVGGGWVVWVVARHRRRVRVP